MRHAIVALALGAAVAALAPAAFPQHPAPAGPAMVHPDERHFRNLRQITFGGQNAEGYWSPDGRKVIYQRMDEAEGVMCDQAFVFELASGKSRRVSNGQGRVTCAYLTDGGRGVMYASTHLASSIGTSSRPTSSSTRPERLFWPTSALPGWKPRP